MTTRLYLQAVTVTDEPPTGESVPIERLFVNAANPSEVWVETEVVSPPDPGRAGVFALSQDLAIGIRTVKGTVERQIRK